MIKINQDVKLRLEEEIEMIPNGEEWWKSTSKKIFFDRGVKLLEHGIEFDEVVTILEDLYWAASAEYGA
jgi:hypothetical protein